MPFTDSDLRALQPQSKKYRESAGDALFVEVYPNGGRYFVWRHRFPPGKEGKQRDYQIGPYGKGPGQWTLKEAREERARLDVLRRQGEDPRALKEEQRQTIQRSLSLVLPADFIGSHIGPPQAHTTGRRHSLAFRCATALFGHLGVEWNLLDASEQDLAGLKHAIALHKRFRPLLHGGDTVRLEHPDDALLLHGVYATDRSEALLCVVQMDTSVALPGTPIRLPGLPAQSRYRISVVPITGGDAVAGPAVSQPGWITDGITLSGAQLASHGLQPPILHPEQALLVHLAEDSSTVRP
jgi:hypothetical protein